MKSMRLALRSSLRASLNKPASLRLPFVEAAPSRFSGNNIYTCQFSTRSSMEPSLLRRHGQRGTYDIDSVKSVFEDCFLAHVAYVDDGLPICLPMIALVREEDPVDNPQATNSIDGDTTNGESHPQRNAVVYLHGHPSSRLMELVRASNRESSNGTETGSSTPKQPVKVCITATKGILYFN